MAKAQLTSAGLALLTNAQGGSDTITFTRMALGDGKVVDISVSSLTALVSQKAEMPIVSKKFVKSGTYQIGAYFSNENITTGFYWRETGIFAKGNDGKEILYCYVNVGDAHDYISVATDIRLEKYIYQTLSVGNSTTINITVNESEMLLTVADIGVAGGVAPLNENKKIDGEFLPDMNYVPIGENGKIDAVYLPSMNYADKDHNHNNNHGGFEAGSDARASTGGAIGSTATTTTGGAVGDNARASSSGGAVGTFARADTGGAVGNMAKASSGGAVGDGAKTGDGFAGGYHAKTVNASGAAIDAIQLGTGKNPNPETLQIYDYQLLDALGKIPTDRIPTNYRKIVVGSYVGTGSYVTGQATQTNIKAGQSTIQLPSYPRLILIKRRTEDIWTQIAPNPDDNTVDFFSYGGNNYAGGLCTGEITTDFKFNWYALTQSWGYKADLNTGKVSIVLESISSDNYATLRPIHQLNWEGNTYDYIAFCD